MQQDTLMQLQQIAAFQRFSKGEYICHEGQPGDDMYVILKGSVGIYLTSALGTLTEVSQVRSGDFFGEMAIFDRLPRSEGLFEQLHNLGSMTEALAAFYEYPDEIHELIKKAVDAANDEMPPYKRVQRIGIRKTEFEKTTTRKIKRHNQANFSGEEEEDI